MQTLPLKGKRSYGKIASLPPEVRNAVDNMILSCTVRIPEIQAYIQEKADVSVSESTVSRYGKRLADSYRDLMIAQESFESLRKEVEKYPEQDAAEVLLRIAIHKMMVALTSKTDEDWNEMRVDKLMREISGVTRAVAYKQRVDMQNKDVVTAALDEVQASVFSALAQEQPELYRQVAKFIERKKKEGFARKKDAQEYERTFKLQQSGSCDMSFEQMTDLYLSDCKIRQKPTSYRVKESGINTHILPYFKDMPINAITVAQVR